MYPFPGQSGANFTGTKSLKLVGAGDKIFCGRVRSIGEESGWRRDNNNNVFYVSRARGIIVVEMYIFTSRQ